MSDYSQPTPQLKSKAGAILQGYYVNELSLKQAQIHHKEPILNQSPSSFMVNTSSLIFYPLNTYKQTFSEQKSYRIPTRIPLFRFLE